MKGKVCSVFGTAYKTQKCPFCGEEQDIVVNGLVPGTEVDVVAKTPDKGYSFCNCKNIFFTNWSNIEQESYNDDYSAKYNNETIYRHVREYAKHYLAKLGPGKGKTFVEIGAASNIVLDEAKERGFRTVGIDINPKSKIATDRHEFVVGDAEDLKTFFPTPDVVWASHVFEHFKDPLSVMRFICAKLNSRGLLFISMPDPWFINWANPYGWLHWAVKEHHILWDMDSFLDELERAGFEIVYSYRNVIQWYCRGDFQVIARKK